VSLRDLAHEGPWGRGLGMPVYEHLLDRMQEGFERRLAAAVDALEAGHGAGALRGASLLAYRGQTIRVQFRATTDFSLPTSFRVDDVSVK